MGTWIKMVRQSGSRKLAFIFVALSLSACAPQKSNFANPDPEDLRTVAMPTNPLAPIYADPTRPDGFGTSRIPSRMPPDRHELPIAPENHDAAIAQADVHCEKSDAASCPASVGMLIAKVGAGLGQCTSFLISDRIVLTNSHCIPDQLKAAGSNCRGKIQIFFPLAEGGKYPAEHANCERVLKASDVVGEGHEGYTLAADYAVLLLTQPVSRPAFTMNRDGLKDGSILHALTIDPQSKQRIEGLLRVKSCTAKQNSIAVPSFMQDFAPVGIFSPCEIIPGNSGSPALDANGQVRAIVHATMPGSEQDNDGVRAKFHAMGLMTNLACIMIPTEAGALTAQPRNECAKTATSDELVRAALARGNQKDLEPLVKQWLEKAPRAIKFESQHSAADDADSVPTVTPQIGCVHAPKKWQPAGGAAKISYVMPFWGFSSLLDEDYRVTIVPRPLEEVSITLEFDTATLVKKTWVAARAKMKSRNSGTTTVNDKFVLRLCEGEN